DRVRRGARQRAAGGERIGDVQDGIAEVLTGGQVPDRDPFLERAGGAGAVVGGGPADRVDAVRVRAGDAQVVNLQVGIVGQVDVERAVRNGDVVAFQQEFVDRVAGISHRDQMVIAADAVGQVDGLAGGVLRAGGQ